MDLKQIGSSSDAGALEMCSIWARSDQETASLRDGVLSEGERATEALACLSHTALFYPHACDSVSQHFQANVFLVRS